MNTTSFPTSPEWSPRVKRTIALIVLAAGVALLWFMQEILPLFIVAALLSFLLYPLVNFFEQRVLRIPLLSASARRGWGVVLTFATVITVIIIALLVIVPVLVKQVEDFVNEIPTLLTSAESEVERILSQPILFNGEPVLLDGKPLIPLERIAEASGTSNLRDVLRLSELNPTEAIETFLTSAGTLTAPAFSFFGGALNTLVNLSFLMLMTFYLLKDGGLFVQGFVSLAPEGYESDAEQIMSQLSGIWNAYIRGQVILCGTMGIAAYIIATLLGLPNAVILGLFTAILEFVPGLGLVLAAIPAVLLALVSQSTTLPFLDGVSFVVVVCIAWSGLQNFEALFLVPRVMGRSLNLHPLAVVVAVLSGAALAGPLGIILAAPSMATARLIARYVYGKLTNRSPFLEVTTPTPIRPTIFSRMAERVQTLISDYQARRQKTASQTE